MLREKFLKSILFPPEDMNGYRLSGSADIMGKSNFGILHLPFTRFPPQLLGDLDGHRYARGSNGMAFGLETPIHIDRNFSAEIGLFGRNQFTSLPFLAKTKI